MAYDDRKLAKDIDARPRFDSYQWEILETLNRGGQVNVLIRELTMEAAYQRLNKLKRNHEVIIDIPDNELEKYQIASEATGVEVETLIRNRLLNKENDTQSHDQWEVRKSSIGRD